MTHITDKLPALAAIELSEANKEYGLFHSLHEGYAVLQEEIEEAEEALRNVRHNLADLWSCCRRDDLSAAVDWAKAAEANALNLAEEAIQTVAMARKMRLYAQTGGRRDEPS